jgi:hypothetical protein
MAFPYFFIIFMELYTDSSQDGTFTKMSYDDWQASTSPKTHGSWNLHTLLPRGMDFFVMLSSIAGVVGSAGQANYAAGNTYMDALAHYRNAQGERTTALDLGVILNHGFLATNDALRDRILRGGIMEAITSHDVLCLLNHYCDPAQSPPSTSNPQVAVGLAPASKLKAAEARGNQWTLSLPFYRHIMAGATETRGQSTGEDSAESRLRQEFVSAPMLADAAVVVSRSLLKRLVIMSPGLQGRLDAKSLDEPLQTFGIDSLQAIELRSWFAREFSADVPIFAILGDETLASIGVLVAEKSKLRATNV